MTEAPIGRRPRAPLAYTLCLAIALALGLACAWGGCGGGGLQRETYVEPEREDPVALERQQVELEAQLAEHLSRAQVDCGAACDLHHRVCDLADRICGIAERHATDTELADRCRDAGERCGGARERVEARCTCEAR